MADYTPTQTRAVLRASLAVGDFLLRTDGEQAGDFALVVGRPDAEHADVMNNSGYVTRVTLPISMRVAVGAPVEDFDPDDLGRFVEHQEIQARAAQARAERLRLAVEAVRQVQANQPGAAAEFARVIGQR